MNSVRDLPKEGLPHSDIRGSTIARISPRLFAACHVLHRLLVPRHPPNALITLAISKHRPHAGPNRAKGQCSNNKLRHTTAHSRAPRQKPIPDSPVNEHPPSRLTPKEWWFWKPDQSSKPAQPHSASSAALHRTNTQTRNQWRRTDSNR